MKTHTRLALLIAVVGIVGVLAYKFVAPHLTNRQQQATSDAGNMLGRVTVRVDNWVGYFPLCSPEMLRRMRVARYTLKCVDDQANYDERFAALANGKTDLAVATADSFLLAGVDHGHPGAVVAVIDQSQGGDALVAWADTLPDIDALKSNPDVTLAYTPNSPSEHLVRALAVDFGIDHLKGGKTRTLRSEGSEAALKALRDRKADAAVLWEPDVSRALAVDGVERIIGTEDTDGLIVDLLVASRRFMKDQPDLLELTLHEYFQTLKFYRGNNAALRKDLGDSANLSDKEIDTLLRGVAWATLTDNVEHWFDIAGAQRGSGALIESLDDSSALMTAFGTISKSPYPDGDVRRLVTSDPINTVSQRSDLDVSRSSGDQTAFSALPSTTWDQLVPVGTLRIRPIVFASGRATLGAGSQTELEQVAKTLKRYPKYRVAINGHTGTRGDPEINRSLSNERAQAVVSALTSNHAIDSNRVKATGYGSDSPLARQPGESTRAYNYRLPRVEVVLLKEVL